MASVWLTLRSGARQSWRPWLGLAVMLGVVAGIALAAAAGARRTDTAYPRLLRWAQASDLQVLSGGSGTGYYRALARLPQVASVAMITLLDMAIPVRRGSPDTAVRVLASTDGRWGTAVDRVKILTGRPLDPSDPMAIMINSQLASREHVRPGGIVRLLGIPNLSGQSNSSPNIAHAFPLAFRVSAIVTFDDQIVPASTAETSQPSALLSPAFLRWAATGLTRQIGTYEIDTRVRLKPGADPTAFARDEAAVARRYPGAGPIAIISQADGVAATERAIRPDAVALVAFAALLGLIALAIIGQLLSRQLILDSAEFGALRAIGMTRGRLAVLSMARVGAVTMLGGLLAVGFAVAASPLTPIGPARLAEPSPGVSINVAVLAVGFAAVALLPLALVAPAAWGAAVGAGVSPDKAERSARVRPPRIGPALSQAGSVSAGVGVQLAFDPGRGRTAVPARSALVATTVAAAAITAALVFGASLDRLTSTPHWYGQDWNAQLNFGFGELPRTLLTRMMSAQPAVSGYAAGNYGQVTVDGKTVAAIGLTPVRGHGYLTLLAGRPPSGPGEIALGARTLRALHHAVGDQVSVVASGNGEGRRPHAMRIVGEVVLASFGRGGYAVTDLGNGAVVSPSLITEPFPPTHCSRGAACYNFILLRYRPGTSPAAEARRLAAAMLAVGCPPGSCSIIDDQRPGDIRNYGGIRATPLVLAAVLALFGVATLAHVLLTTVRRRRRDLALLRVLGFRGAQLRAVATWQAGALTAVSLIAGIPLGILAGRWSWVLFAGQVGVAPDSDVPTLRVLVMAGTAILLAGVMAIRPGRAAAQQRPAAVLRSE